MLKNILKFILKAFLLFIMLLIPTIIVLIYYVIRFRVPKAVSVVFLYFIPIIFIALIVSIILYVWKKPYSLFVLPIGFLVLLKFVPIGLSFLGMRRAFGGGFGGESMEIALLGALYAFPFAVITLIIAILMTIKSLHEIQDSLPSKKG